MKSFFLRAYRIGCQAAKDQINVYAAQASYFILISAVPLIMLIISLIQFISPLSQAELMSAMIKLLPTSMHSSIIVLINELFSNSSGVIISVTTVTVLWSASKGIYALSQGLNHIYKVEESRGFIFRRVFSLFYTLIFILIIILSLVLLVFGNRLQLLIEHSTPWFAQVSSYIISIRTLLAIVILTFLFTLLYSALPDSRRRFGSQLPGAVFSTIGWMLFSFAFSIYIDNFSNYSYIYGSLTAIILLMLWMYTCLCILLVGAEINLYLEQSERI